MLFVRFTYQDLVKVAVKQVVQFLVHISLQTLLYASVVCVSKSLAAVVQSKQPAFTPLQYHGSKQMVSPVPNNSPKLPIKL